VARNNSSSNGGTGFVKGDFQARFRENAGVEFPCVTRLSAAIGNPANFENLSIKQGQYFNFDKQNQIAIEKVYAKSNLFSTISGLFFSLLARGKLQNKHKLTL
jgi:hypothetical protein